MTAPRTQGSLMTEDTRDILPPLPLTISERNALAGEGTIAAALAVQGWRFVQCTHGSIPAAEWHEHTHEFAQIGPDADDVQWIERIPDYIHDCMVLFRMTAPRTESTVPVEQPGKRDEWNQHSAANASTVSVEPLNPVVKGKRYPRFDNGQTETIYAIEVDHPSGRWEQIWVLRSEELANRVAATLDAARASQPVTATAEKLRDLRYHHANIEGPDPAAPGASSADVCQRWSNVAVRHRGGDRRCSRRPPGPRG